MQTNLRNCGTRGVLSRVGGALGRLISGSEEGDKLILEAHIGLMAGMKTP